MKDTLEKEVESLKRVVEFLAREVGRKIIYNNYGDAFCVDARGKGDEQWFYSQFKLLLDYLRLEIIPNPKAKENIPSHIIRSADKMGGTDGSK